MDKTTKDVSITKSISERGIMVYILQRLVFLWVKQVFIVTNR